MDSEELKYQILDQLMLPPQESVNLMSITIVSRKEVPSPAEHWPCHKLPVIDDESTFNDELAVYLMFPNKIEIYQSVKVYIDETDYELITNFVSEIKVKLGSRALEISPEMQTLFVLNFEGKILLLRLNGEFLGTISHKSWFFTSICLSGYSLYIGAVGCKILTYDLVKLRYSNKTITIDQDIIQNFPEGEISELKIVEKDRLMFYSLNNGMEGHIDLREKPKQVTFGRTVQQPINEDRANFIHTLSNLDSFSDQEPCNFCTVSKYGTLQKYWKVDKEFESIMFHLLSNPELMNTKIMSDFEEDKVK